MLDDRNTTPDPALAPTATWTYDNNYTGWHALLGDALGGPSVSPIAAPARGPGRTSGGPGPALLEAQPLGRGCDVGTPQTGDRRHQSGGHQRAADADQHRAHAGPPPR